MKKVLIATTICTVMLASCGQNSAEYKKLRAENDSLKIENAKSSAEMKKKWRFAALRNYILCSPKHCIMLVAKILSKDMTAGC